MESPIKKNLEKEAVSDGVVPTARNPRWAEDEIEEINNMGERLGFRTNVGDVRLDGSGVDIGVSKKE